ncbi:MAG: polysaccharide biosynthesis/export family protein [Gammaproteobacteria bacterium]|nr:polysaccharide biosynthesis/export family protein [Gammaproteobacteria bacterium]
MKRKNLLIKFLFLVLLLITSLACLAEEKNLLYKFGYKIQPGDILSISVWREPDMQLEVLVKPDGRLSFPLVGELSALGKTTEQLKKEVTDGLVKYIPDLSVNVAVKQPDGNKIYVIGKVNKPGEFVMSRQLDVMQALSIAGGTAKFASLDDIRILRRQNDKQKVYLFEYSAVEKGKNLSQNILLQSGDIVVVP